MWKGGVPVSTGRGVWGGCCAPPINLFLIFELKMTSLGVFWELISLQLNTIYPTFFTFTHRSSWVSSVNDLVSVGGRFSRHLCVKGWGDFCMTAPA